MDTKLPLDISVLSDASIEELVCSTGLQPLDDEQMAFCRTLDTCDVQAAPGCGKTTLVGLKLCLIARGWQPTRRGICVLSHTNVAKDLVVSILRKDEHGARLLQAPHYIGTIQGFVDAFVALPYARSIGWDPRHVSKDLLGDHLLSLATRGQFKTLYFALQKRQNWLEILRSAQYFYVDGELVALPADIKFPFGQTSSSYTQYQELKKIASADGYFGFGDMFAIAQQAVTVHPWLRSAIGLRFPFLLIDEMQDTSRLQWDTLSTLLSPECVVQRVGDANQALYSDGASFPASDALELKTSRRFGQRIADVVTRLAVSRPQEIRGSPSIADDRVALFLFDEGCAQRVIVAFKEHAIATLAEYLPGLSPIAALGPRRDRGDAEGMPVGVSYYTKAPVVGAPLPRGLIPALHRARHQWSTLRDAEAAHETTWRALSEVISLWTPNTRSRLNGPRAKRWLSDRDRDAYQRFNLEIYRCLAGTPTPTIDTAVKRLFAILEGVIGAPPSKAARELAKNVEPGAGFHLDPDEPSDLGVTVDTTHSAKGETHCATLLLEGKHRHGKAFDLEVVLPIALGLRNPGSVTAKDCARLAFVAASRPRYLLAFAVHGDHAAPYLEAAREAGWEVLDLRAG